MADGDVIAGGAINTGDGLTAFAIRSPMDHPHFVSSMEQAVNLASNTDLQITSLLHKLNESHQIIEMLRGKVEVLEYTVFHNNASPTSPNYYDYSYAAPQSQIGTLLNDVTNYVDDSLASVRRDVKNEIRNNLCEYMPINRICRGDTVDKELAVLLKKLLDIAYNSEVEDPKEVLGEVCKTIREILFLTVVTSKCEKEYKMLLTKSIPKVQPQWSLYPVDNVVAVGSNVLGPNRREDDPDNMLVNDPNDDSGIIAPPDRRERTTIFGGNDDTDNEAIEHAYATTEHADATIEHAYATIEHADATIEEDTTHLIDIAERTRADLVDTETRQGLRRVLSPQIVEFIRGNIDLYTPTFQSVFDPVSRCMITTRPHFHDIQVQSIDNPNDVRYVDFSDVGLRR